jgi:hypothetical protein
LSYGDWKLLLDSKKFDYKSNKELYEKVKMSAYLGIHDEPKNIARQTAWLYMLGIDPRG